jgi:RNA polymerase sporulation-specific sigma factor
MIQIEENLPLVHSLAHRLQGRGVEYEELFSAGSEGLVKAAKGFDESKGFAFSTYAVPVILGEMKRLFRDGGSVKVGRAIKSRYIKIQRAREKLSVSFSREPTVSEIANETGFSAEDIIESEIASQPTVSLSTDLPIASDSEEEEIISRVSLEDALESLSEQDREIVRLRYFCEQTQSKTAKRLNMSQVQVSRRERAILQKLRLMLKA